MKFLFDDETFSFETLRTTGFANYFGADLGEVLATAARIKDGDQASWHQGALTGIGRATAVAFARKGANVVVSGRHDDAGQALVTELRALGAEAEFVRADVQKEDDVRNLVDRTVERFGRLDAAVNNAGVEGETGPIEDGTVENFRFVHDTNVLGVS